MSRLIAWAVVLLVLVGIYRLGADWTPPPGVSLGAVSPVLRDMPAVPAGCKALGDCP